MVDQDNLYAAINVPRGKYLERCWERARDGDKLAVSDDLMNQLECGIEYRRLTIVLYYIVRSVQRFLDCYE